MAANPISSQLPSRAARGRCNVGSTFRLRPTGRRAVSRSWGTPDMLITAHALLMDGPDADAGYIGIIGTVLEVRYRKTER
jgi:hypothetical protein